MPKSFGFVGCVWALAGIAVEVSNQFQYGFPSRRFEGQPAVLVLEGYSGVVLVIIVIAITGVLIVVELIVLHEKSGIGQNLKTTATAKPRVVKDSLHAKP